MIDSDSQAKLIVLIHGLSRRPVDMWLFEKRLSKLLPEYRIYRFGYKSQRFSVSEIADQLAIFVRSIAQQNEEVSFVGHSLGGIVAEQLVISGRLNGHLSLKRLVTLGSPHTGSKMAKYLAKIRPLRWFLGPSFVELASQIPSAKLIASGERLPIEIGSIIGSTGTRFGFLPFFGEDNDGLVTVSEAGLSSAKAQLKLFVFHGLFPLSLRAAKNSASFIKNGVFL